MQESLLQQNTPDLKSRSTMSASDSLFSSQVHNSTQNPQFQYRFFHSLPSFVNPWIDLSAALPKFAEKLYRSYEGYIGYCTGVVLSDDNEWKALCLPDTSNPLLSFQSLPYYSPLSLPVPSSFVPIFQPAPPLSSLTSIRLDNSLQNNPLFDNSLDIDGNPSLPFGGKLSSTNHLLNSDTTLHLLRTGISPLLKKLLLAHLASLQTKLVSLTENLVRMFSIYFILSKYILSKSAHIALESTLSAQFSTMYSDKTQSFLTEIQTQSPPNFSTVSNPDIQKSVIIPVSPLTNEHIIPQSLLDASISNTLTMENKRDNESDSKTSLQKSKGTKGKQKKTEKGKGNALQTLPLPSTPPVTPPQPSADERYSPTLNTTKERLLYLHKAAIHLHLLSQEQQRIVFNETILLFHLLSFLLRNQKIIQSSRSTTINYTKLRSLIQSRVRGISLPLQIGSTTPAFPPQFSLLHRPNTHISYSDIYQQLTQVLPHLSIPTSESSEDSINGGSLSSYVYNIAQMMVHFTSVPRSINRAKNNLLDSYPGSYVVLRSHIFPQSLFISYINYNVGNSLSTSISYDPLNSNSQQISDVPQYRPALLSPIVELMLIPSNDISLRNSSIDSTSRLVYVVSTATSDFSNSHSLQSLHVLTSLNG